MRARGLSLLEVTVATVLLGIVLLAVVELLPSSMLSLQRSEDIEAATAYAIYMLDDARLHPQGLSDFETDFVAGKTSFHVVRHAEELSTGLVDVIVTVKRPRGADIVLGTRVSPSAP